MCTFFNSYEGGHCDPLNRKLRENPAQLMIYVFDRVENIAGKGENAGFLQLSFSGSSKVVIVWKRVNPKQTNFRRFKTERFCRQQFQS